MVDSTGCVAAGRRMGCSRRRERPQGRLGDACSRAIVASGTAQTSPRAAQLVESIIQPAGTKDSPLRLAFGPPTERTFESPLRSVRLASTYSAALSGAQGKLRDPRLEIKWIIAAVCVYPSETTTEA